VSNPLVDGMNIPELKRRVLITLGLLFVYRLGCHITTPGVDAAAMENLVRSAGEAGGVLGFMDLFSGGALSQFSIFALGIMPYISTSIVMQLLTEVWPALKQLQKEGDAGRKKITQYTRYGTVVLAAVHAVGMTNILRSIDPNHQIIRDPSFGWVALTVITLTTGTLFVMWLGEQITEFGIGNGMSLLIFTGIVARLPQEFKAMYQSYQSGNISFFGILFFMAVMAGLVGLTIMVQTAYRKIPVQYAQRMQGRRMMGGGTTVLPLKIDYSGVIAVIFASSLLVFPTQIIHYLKSTAVDQNSAWFLTMERLEGWLGQGQPVYVILYIALILFFCYFYTALVFNPDDVAENMKKHGGFIPGLRPGKATAEYIGRILDRVTLWGSLAVIVIAVVPDTMARSMTIGWYFGGTTLLIVVGVALDTMRQVESHLLMRHYDGFMKDVRIKGRS
jgi:preprotein translocase subunit SecY